MAGGGNEMCKEETAQFFTAMFPLKNPNKSNQHCTTSRKESMKIIYKFWRIQ